MGHNSHLLLNRRSCRASSLWLTSSQLAFSRPNRFVTLAESCLGTRHNSHLLLNKGSCRAFSLWLTSSQSAFSRPDRFVTMDGGMYHDSVSEILFLHGWVQHAWDRLLTSGCRCCQKRGTQVKQAIFSCSTFYYSASRTIVLCCLLVLPFFPW